MNIQKIYLILLIGAFLPFSNIAQKSNRISLQTGFLQFHFDGTPAMNFVSNKLLDLQSLGFVLTGYLGNSGGINYEREITHKSFVSIEYMVYHPGFIPNKNFTSDFFGPTFIAKYLKKFNLNYTRKLHVANKLKFTYGGGINYYWGKEVIYLFTTWTGVINEPHFFIFHRNDFGLNTRIGLEYSPLKWLTIYTQLNFMGIVVMNARGSWPGMPHVKASTFFKDKYSRDDIPSRMSLSWRFGIGFNFD